jgi:hypothetical protein
MLYKDEEEGSIAVLQYSKSKLQKQTSKANFKSKLQKQIPQANLLQITEYKLAPPRGRPSIAVWNTVLDEVPPFIHMYLPVKKFTFKEVVKGIISRRIKHIVKWWESCSSRSC